MEAYDAVVVGAGPNGLSAAIVLARAGLSVLLREAAPDVGGGARTEALTLPGYLHDVCSAIHPLGAGSPFFSRLPLGEHGLSWIHPDAPLGHAFEREPPVFLERDLAATAAALGPDATAYAELVGPWARAWSELAPDLLGPVHIPKHPLLLARFGLLGLQPADALVHRLFRTMRARALFAGMAAHAILPLTKWGTSAFGLVMAATGHAVGWPMPAGGSRNLAFALASYFRSLGGTIMTRAPVQSISELPRARAIVLDLTPRQVLRVAGDRLPARYHRALQGYRYGPGVFKVDWALDGPVPWRHPELLRAGTVHVGGTSSDVGAAEAMAWRGEHPERPFMLVAQQSRFDPSRAPAGAETLWAYCHVPNGSTANMLPRMEAQLERLAPGFRERVLARHVMTTERLEAHNANLVGGDIAGGANTLRQILFRPAMRAVPYATPARGLYLCSASTPPGGGVHGMCGYHAANVVLRREFGIRGA